MKKLENLEQLETGRKILLFTTDWCGDCIVLKGYINNVVEAYKDKFEFIYVDRDENIELAKHYNVFGIPSFIALDESKVIGEMISKESKSFTQIVEWIESLK
jgi:thiol-disulfide isomerase/thioredoxin